MLNPKNVSCVIVTRGNVDFAEIRKSLSFGEIIVWNNGAHAVTRCRGLSSTLFSEIADERVFGRYQAAKYATNDVIVTQDDDAIIEDWPAILAAYEPGVVMCNMGAAHAAYYKPMNLALVGFGAIFDKVLIAPTFDRYFERFPKDELFARECDRVFTGLNRLNVVSVPYRNLSHEQTTERMWREARHGSDLAEIRQRVDQIRHEAVRLTA